MDFKIAGTQKGICSLQLDVKNHGISLVTFQQACEKGKKARIYLLNEMNQKISSVRPRLASQAIKFRKILVGTERFGLIIGNQGKIINQLTQLTGVTVDLQPDGFAFLYHSDEKQLSQAVQFIEEKLKNKKNLFCKNAKKYLL
jgi:polyribonucleotide nucleotidyltransferase